MEKMLNPVQVFRSREISKKVAMEKLKNSNEQVASKEIFKIETTFLPVEFDDPNILFWRVPDLLENNEKNLPVYDITPGEDVDELGFFNLRSGTMASYIEQYVKPEINKAYEDDESPVSTSRLYYHYTNLIRLLETSGGKRVGAHLAGLYFDCSKLNDLLKLPFEERERIVDNNLVLANVACMYAAYAENHDTANCQDAKELFKRTLALVGNPKVHIKPLCCMIALKKTEIEDENGKKVIKTEYDHSKKNYKIDDPTLKPNELIEKKISIAEDLKSQYDNVAEKKEKKLNPNIVYIYQKEQINQAEKKAKIEDKFEF